MKNFLIIIKAIVSLEPLQSYSTDKTNPCQAMKRKKSIFEIPIFEIDIDLNRIDVPDGLYKRMWESKVKSNIDSCVQPSKETLEYLIDKMTECFSELHDKIDAIEFCQIWRNKYEQSDFQGYHTHSVTNWSFIIYEDVEISKTEFINPNMSDILNQCHMPDSKDFPVKYVPNLESGKMILFPSWLPHQVLNGNVGSTISGNIKCHVKGLTFK